MKGKKLTCNPHCIINIHSAGRPTYPEPRNLSKRIRSYVVCSFMLVKKKKQTNAKTKKLQTKFKKK